MKEVEAKLGPYKYEPATENDVKDTNLMWRGPVKLDNKSVYLGQWSRSGHRCGRGVQVWEDGAKYEGMWKEDMANGKGRLIHADGDVYFGEWLKDKAHGYGEYSHMDGAVYQGEWKEDR